MTRCTLALFFFLSIAFQAVHAVEFVVEFAMVRDRHLASNTFDWTTCITQRSLSFHRWRFGTPSDVHKGSHFINWTGKAIQGVHLKVASGDTINVNTYSGGSVFSEIWRKKDQTEVVFSRASIYGGEKFWARVLPVLQPDSSETIEARFLHHETRLLSNKLWEKLAEPMKLVHQRESVPWRNLWSKQSNRYGEVQAYCESSGGTHVLLFANGIPFLYVDSNKTLKHVIFDVPISSKVNRITMGDKRDGVFVLWYSGRKVAELCIAELELVPFGKGH